VIWGVFRPLIHRAFSWDMTAVTGARGGLKAHQDFIRLADDVLVRDLRDLLGAKLVAYIGSVKETRPSGNGPTGNGSPPPTRCTG
jgi:hypothetical protein